MTDWSEYQRNIFEFVEHGQGSAVIIAVAGSGKTSTIVEAARRIPENRTVTFCAFNKSIAEELSTRLPGYVRAQTLNSLGYRALIRYLGTKCLTVDSRKTQAIIRESLLPAEGKLYNGGLRKLVSLAKAHGLLPKGMRGTALLLDTEQNWVDLMERYDVEFEGNADPLKGIDYARLVLQRSIAMGQQIIDFDDQLYLPVIWQARFFQHDLLFVDEAQDVNTVQRAMIRMALKPEGRGIFVGDPCQCQPQGTLVEVAEKAGRYQVRRRIQTPIELLRPGMHVSAYSVSNGGVTARRINKVAMRAYIGQLVEVQDSRGCISRYTPNHRCIVRLPLDGYCTYIMRRGQAYRIGMSRLTHAQLGAGPLLRLRTEDADAVWLLDTYSDKRQALMAEATISALFHLPQLMFTAKPTAGSVFTQNELDSVWREIQNEAMAKLCLQRYGRLFEYPYFTRQQQGTLRRPHETVAANLLPGSLLHQRRFDRKRKRRGGDWVPVEIRRVPYEGLLYSLQIEKDETYYGDGFLTHNSIYGFRGAGTNSIEEIKAEFSAREFPLSVSYRCPRAVVRAAQTYVDYIQPSDTAPEGKVLALDDFGPDTFQKGDAVLCRNTAPLINLAFTLLGAGTACKVLGRDIGQGLVRLINKMGAETVDELEGKLDAYQEREIRKLTAKGKEDQASTIEDKVQTIRIFIAKLPENERTIEYLVDWIGKLFTDDGQGILTLTTVHKAKGLEWPRVFILDAFLMPSRWARQAWQQQQERNVAYVAITRAKAELYYIDSRTWREKEDRNGSRT